MSSFSRAVARNSLSISAVCVACAGLLSAAPASAATVDVCLRVDQTQIPGPVPPATVGPFGNPAPITVWGFVTTGVGPNCTFALPAPAATTTAIPIPKLSAVQGDTLVIHLQNNLPAAVPPVVTPGGAVTPGVFSEPVSVVIPGQPGDMTPTWNDGTTGNRTSLSQRVRSFTKETLPQSAVAVTYSFGPLQAGSYLIESGTHPAVQVQMGLYGVLEVLPATAGRAYADASTAFDSELSLLFSEIDPVLHDAVATGRYGALPAGTALPPGWLTSTVDYHPRYFLVNGKPFTAGTPATMVGATNRKVLLRLLNAGLGTKVPTLQGQVASIVAEDGHFLSAGGFTGAPPNVVAATCPAPRPQYAFELPSGKTVDAILTTPSTAVSIPVYDRRFHLTNNGTSPGGMFTVLSTTAVGGAASPPPPPPPCAITCAVAGGPPAGPAPVKPAPAVGAGGRGPAFHVGPVPVGRGAGK